MILIVSDADVITEVMNAMLIKIATASIISCMLIITGIIVIVS